MGESWCQQYVQRMATAEKVALIATCFYAPRFRYDGKQEDTSDVWAFFREHEIPVMQMWCAEILHAGCPRLPRTKDMYDTSTFRTRCRKIIESDILPNIRALQGKLYFVGVQKSPTCGCTITTTGPDMENAELTCGQGIFVEELVNILGEHGREITPVDIHYRRRDLSILEEAFEVGAFA